jgi:hypothetical protein
MMRSNRGTEKGLAKIFNFTSVSLWLCGEQHFLKETYGKYYQ